VFRAAFVYALLNEYPLRKMLRFANAAAAVSCTRAGAMASVPSLRDADALVSGG
jgi:sugar/nucleoside kinase (ribokinase family)